MFVGGEVEESNCKRAAEYEELNFLLEQQLNAEIEIVWNQFDHSTCNLLGYLAQAYEDEAELDETLTLCFKTIDNLQKDPTPFSEASTEMALSYDQASGDCSAIHYKLFKNQIGFRTLQIASCLPCRA